MIEIVLLQKSFQTEDVQTVLSISKEWTDVYDNSWRERKMKLNFYA